MLFFLFLSNWRLSLHRKILMRKKVCSCLERFPLSFFRKPYYACCVSSSSHSYTSDSTGHTMDPIPNCNTSYPNMDHKDNEDRNHSTKDRSSHTNKDLFPIRSPIRGRRNRDCPIHSMGCPIRNNRGIPNYYSMNLHIRN